MINLQLYLNNNKKKREKRINSNWNNSTSLFLVCVSCKELHIFWYSLFIDPSDTLFPTSEWPPWSWETLDCFTSASKRLRQSGGNTTNFFFWTLTILSILLWFLACCTFLTPFCEWILPLILHYLHAIYFLPGTFKDKKCTSLTFLFLWRSVYNIKICLLSNLSGGSRKVTNPLKVELGTVTSI